MKRIKKHFLFLLFSFSTFMYAQKPTDVLVTINDSIYTVADFERLYNKNIDVIADESQKDIDNYFELYKTYKLRLQHAYSLGIDQSPKVQQEFVMYRKELAEKYFINEKELNRLLDEALERNKWEVNASHILITVDEFAASADTLKAYNQAINVRNEILKGLPFEDAAVAYSNDLSAKHNKGNLGYFSVFKMVYPFESGAYNTPVGAISMPIRTKFGYHLIKVHKKRPAPKTKRIAHILVETKDKEQGDAQKKINEIYKRLEVGDSFFDVAFHFSEDIHTRDNGGDLGIYNEGTLNIDGISDILYELNFKDAYSKPFTSQYGWHIVAVTDIKEQPEEEDLKANFLRKIKSDERSKVLEKDLMDHLKELYQFKVNTENLSKTVSLLNRTELMNQPKVEQTKETESVVAVFTDNQITVKNILEHIYSFPNKYAATPTDELLVKKAFNFYTLQKLKETYNSNLERNFPEFAHTLHEYKEGLMLFDLLEEKIWNATANDTVALQNYFEQHQSNYTQPAHFIGEVYVFNNKSDAKTYHKLLKNNYTVKEADFPMVYKYQGRFYRNDKRLPENLDFNSLGKKIIKWNNLYYVFYLRDKKDSYEPAFEEVKSKVITDYQVLFEKQFNEQLKEKASIEANQAVLNQLKAKYNKKNLN
ncbi:peptidylprolyl isomerase [Flavobacterium sp. CBA20B-1]|uniref:peptidylprolyl isomerase n=1 Tax=unclassified Flavobacterium TaxID=196869 RepID=UPI002225A6D9|nr:MULTISPECIES: peptidylprolyl isomerase [unclassified Flavobacterium]WCM42786.1 peptidylprolyl isomerase [Flavobacterium sp. CBA20B-1]